MSIAERALSIAKARVTDAQLICEHSTGICGVEDELQADTLDSEKFTLKAVEKQIPMKIISEPGRIIFSMHKCPCCKIPVYVEDKYCRYCGQALKWEE